MLPGICLHNTVDTKGIIEPGPILRIGQPVDIILQALLKFCQVKVQVRPVISIGFRMAILIILNGQVYCICGITVIVKIEA